MVNVINAEGNKNTRKKVGIDINFVAFKYEDLKFLDDVFKKIEYLEKEYKIDCTPISININN